MLVRKDHMGRAVLGRCWLCRSSGATDTWWMFWLGRCAGELQWFRMVHAASAAPRRTGRSVPVSAPRADEAAAIRYNAGRGSRAGQLRQRNEQQNENSKFTVCPITIYQIKGHRNFLQQLYLILFMQAIQASVWSFHANYSRAGQVFRYKYRLYNMLLIIDINQKYQRIWILYIVHTFMKYLIWFQNISSIIC